MGRLRAIVLRQFLASSSSESDDEEEGPTDATTSIKVEKIDTVDVSDEAGEDVPMAVDGTEKEKEASPEEIIPEDQNNDKEDITDAGEKTTEDFLVKVKQEKKEKSTDEKVKTK